MAKVMRLGEGPRALLAELARQLRLKNGRKGLQQERDLEVRADRRAAKQALKAGKLDRYERDWRPRYTGRGVI